MSRSSPRTSKYLSSDEYWLIIASASSHTMANTCVVSGVLPEAARGLWPHFPTKTTCSDPPDVTHSDVTPPRAISHHFVMYKNPCLLQLSSVFGQTLIKADPLKTRTTPLDYMACCLVSLRVLCSKVIAFVSFHHRHRMAVRFSHI